MAFGQASQDKINYFRNFIMINQEMYI